ncbi:HMG box domain-containing protein [Haematococcus lacustris]|uniref:HMG box domain-containing protein n=1 Tax=Haematococcus lacustris TaxID=44745 RepID=A0A6A0AJN6_HAELA|nr:HMG box domain-containing protein [Haematococcus lacustris]
MEKKKDPNAPKKPLSSYMIWCQENRERIKTDHPDMKLTEISSEMGRQWKEVDEDTKKEYHAKAETEKGKYKKAMEGTTLSL